MKNKKRITVEGIPLQKKHGQYFLRDEQVTKDMLAAIDLKDASVFEIGCGDGFLTKAILKNPLERLFVFEIDPLWAKNVATVCKEKRFTMHEGDFLQIDREQLVAHAPWIVFSNLPYHLTFPILHKIKDFGALVTAGVYMMQEEVAQKIVKKSGKGYGYVSLFFQYYFDWKLLSKVPPHSFIPEPKVFSRLISFVRKENPPLIPREEEFWKFIRLCFSQPRRTLRNNLAQTHIPLEVFSSDVLDLRSQQMSMADFLDIWEKVSPYFTGKEEIGSL